MNEPRTTLTNRQWRLIEPFLPGRPGTRGRSGRNNRRSLEAMIWVIRTGAPWRDLPPVLGHWNTVHHRFRRWPRAAISSLILCIHRRRAVVRGLSGGVRAARRSSGSHKNPACAVRTRPDHRVPLGSRQRPGRMAGTHQHHREIHAWSSLALPFQNSMNGRPDGAARTAATRLGVATGWHGLDL